MRLLYVNHYAGGPSLGMEYRPHYLAREWIAAGHDVTVVAASFAHVRSRQPEVAERFSRQTVDGVPYLFCRTPAYAGNGLGRVRNMMAFLRALGAWKTWLDASPDVVIASSTYPADVAAVAPIARAAGAGLVWEVHDLWPLSPIELGGMSPRHPFAMWMQRAENQACRTADLVVSLLPLAEAHLRSHGLPAGRFVHIPNGIDAGEWSEEDLPLPAAHAAAIAEARARGDLLVAYTGAHGIANDLDTLVEAATLARDEPVTWLLVGDGPEKARLAETVASRGLARVHLLDPVPKALIPTLLRAMDVLYLGLQPQPLFRFGISPNKLMDYMMAGRPVVSAIAAGNDPVGEAGCGVSVAPGEPKAVAQAVLALASRSPEERAAMGVRGREYVRGHHSYAVLAASFIDAVSPIAARRAAS